MFFIGIFFAYYISKLPKTAKGICDCVLTLPMVLPPTVVGYLLLLITAPKRPLGAFFLKAFNIRLTMVWWASIGASVLVSFPLMYRASRGAFESFDEYLTDAAKCLGIPKFKSFWGIRVPCCKDGLIAGAVLSFARALGEYGATSMVSGYTPGRTATISTTVYQLWQTGDDTLALKWVIVNISISFVMLIAINMFEGNRRKKIRWRKLKSKTL